MTAQQRLYRRIASAGAAALALLGTGPARAAGHYYTFGGAPDNAWTNAANWGNSLGNPQAGYPDDASDFAYLGDFPAGTNALTIHVAGTQVLQTVVMQSTNHAYTLEGDRLACGAPAGFALDHFDGSTRDFVVNCDLLMPSTSRIRNWSSGPATLTIDGAIVVESPGQLDVWNNGTGPIVLNASNTIGDIVMHEGAHLVLGHESALGTNGDISVTAVTGAILGLATNAVFDGGIHISGGGLALRVEAGDTDHTLTLARSSESVNMLSADGLTYTLATNAAGGAGNITLRLVPADTHDRAMDNLSMIVEEGCTLEIDNANGDLLWDRGQGLVGGAGRFVKNGTNTLQTKRAFRHSGGTWINAGRLELLWHNDDYHGELPATGVCTVAEGAVVDFHDAATVPYRAGALAGGGRLELGGSTLELNEGFRFEDGGGTTLTADEGGSIVLGTNAWSVFELGGLADPGDRVVFTGTAGVTLGGVLDIKDIGGLEAGVYTLIDLSGGAIAGSFSTVNLPELVVGTVRTDSGDVLLDVFSIRPRAPVLIVR